MIGKGATPSFFAIANDNYTLTILEFPFQFFIHIQITSNNKGVDIENYSAA